MTVHADRIVQNPYADYQETIREVFVRVVSRPEFPFPARLFSMACFALEADVFVYPGNPDFTEAQLADEVNRVADFTYERLWMEEFQGKSVNLELPMSIVQSLLLGRVRTCLPTFNEMILAAWSEYVPGKGSGGSQRLLDIRHSETTTLVKCAALTRQYAKRRDHMFDLMGEDLEKQLQDFCVRYIEARGNTEDLTLLAYVQRLMLHVALLKYFLTSDPDLAVGIRQIDADAPQSTEFRRSVARAVSGVVERFEFHIGKEAGALDALHRTLAEQGMQDFAHTMLFVFF